MPVYSVTGSRLFSTKVMKKVYIIHGWDGTPESNWFPWLEHELTALGFQVNVPQLPDAHMPRIEKWVPALTAAVGVPDEDTYFVGHSMGCQAIVRYLEGLLDGVKVGGAVFVAGYFRPITNLEQDAESIAVDREWATTPIDFTAVRTHLPRCIAIFSTTDPYVSLDNREDFAQKLGSEIVTLENRGHFYASDDGITELPQARDAIIKMAHKTNEHV